MTFWCKIFFYLQALIIKAGCILSLGCFSRHYGRLVVLLLSVNMVLLPRVFALDNALNIYIGSNYIAESTIRRIEHACNCKVFQNYFNDNEEMLAKIVAGAKGYNNIVATSYAVEMLTKINKLQQLDLKRIPNLRYVDKQFLNTAYDPRNQYSVPYAYTPVFLAYNAEKLNTLGITPNSWAVVFDPYYLAKLKGHVIMFNSARNVFAAALLYLGKDPNSQNLQDLLSARAVIERASPYWAKFDSDSYYRALLRGDIWVSMAYSIDLFKTIQDAKASHLSLLLRGMLQREGNMYELDNVVIPKTTANLDYSYAFINSVLDPQNQYDLAVATGASVPSPLALTKLKPELRAIEWVYPKNMQKMHVFTAYAPKTRILVSEMWTEIQMRCNF